MAAVRCCCCCFSPVVNQRFEFKEEKKKDKGETGLGNLKTSAGVRSVVSCKYSFLEAKVSNVVSRDLSFLCFCICFFFFSVLAAVRSRRP